MLEHSGQRRFYEAYGRDVLKRDQSLLSFAENVYQELENKQNA